MNNSTLYTPPTYQSNATAPNANHPANMFWFYPMDPRILGHNHPKGPLKNQPPNHHSTAVPEAAGTTMGIDVYNSCLGDPSGTVDGFGGLPEHFPVSQPG